MSKVEGWSDALARLMRRVTGVPESLLSKVPSERPRYTGLAWTMIAACRIASIGMIVLVAQISRLPAVIVLALVLGWGLSILGIDFLIGAFLLGFVAGESLPLATPPSSLATQPSPLATQPSLPGARKNTRLHTVENRSFLLIRAIGAGSFATVWFAEPANAEAFEHDYPIVVKVPNDDTTSRNQLAREYHLYKTLADWHGFPILVCGDQSGLVLRYYPRTSLDRWFFSGSSGEKMFSYNTLIGWLTDVVDDLETIWTNGYVHGDGKPANLVITGDSNTGDAGEYVVPDRVLLIDFGSAVRLGDRTNSASLGYIPPEVLALPDSVTATPYADIYSFLGATLYYLCSGGISPWQDQVRYLWPDLTPGERPADRELKDLQKAWVQATVEQPLTPLEVLNPELHKAILHQVGTWMEPVPESRLVVGGKSSDQWMLGTSEWEAHAIAERLREQVSELSQELKAAIGSDGMAEPLLGALHYLAVPADAFPDFTIERETLGEMFSRGEDTT